MKTLHLVALFVFIIATVFTARAQQTSLLQKEDIKVWGECGMCKQKIEKAALTTGVETASWNEFNKVLAVTYKTGKTSAQKIQEAVAAAGYDTNAVVATTAAYNSLPGCCHYQRREPAAETAKNCCTDAAAVMACCKDAACCKEGKCDTASCKDITACKGKASSKS